MSWNSFSPLTFLSLEMTLVVIPAVVVSFVIWLKARSPRFEVSEWVDGAVARGWWPRWGRPGRLSRWQTGLLAFVLGFIACVGWLSWTAEDKSGDFRGPSYPPPGSFPSWQIVALGVTVVAFAVLTSMYAKKVKSGALIAPLLCAAGFSTAMSAGSSYGKSSQEGIGIFFSMFGLTVGLGIITLLCAALRAGKLKRLAK